jgi:hypothetical protein
VDLQASLGWTRRVLRTTEDGWPPAPRGYGGGDVRLRVAGFEAAGRDDVGLLTHLEFEEPQGPLEDQVGAVVERL